MITAIAFDLTGVITQSPLVMLDEYGDRLSLPPKTLSGFFRTDMFRDVLLGRIPMSTLVENIEATVQSTYDIVIDRGAIYDAMRASRVIDPRIAALIRDLKPHYRLAVLTNNANDVVDSPRSAEMAWWTDDSPHALIPRDFEFVMSSDELGVVKPDPLIYEQLVRRLAVAPEQVVYIDDTATNLAPAQALGMATIEYRDADQCRNALRSLGVRGADAGPADPNGHDKAATADGADIGSANGFPNPAGPAGGRSKTAVESNPGRVVLLDGSARVTRELVGNKAFGIDAMRRCGVSVPPAFAVTTEVCAQFFADPERTLDATWDAIVDGIRLLERHTSRAFGHGPRPLLVSVRSSGAQSMPGMMDTVLNLGMNDTVEAALAAASSTDFARDTRRRFIEMYRRIVLAGNDSASVPDDPYVQLRAAIEAVFASWNSPRARVYRSHHGLDERAGTAVVVQAMVFGNSQRCSGTGVMFSRNPMTGANEPFGEWLPGGQGEDVVSGRFDCQPLSALRSEQPRVYDELMSACHTLETHYADVQDIEYTVEEGRLWLLQTRAAKRSAPAAVRLALQLHREGLIDDAEALRRVTPEQVHTLLLPSLHPETRLAAPLLAKGLPACPGVVSGRAYSDVDDALDAADAGEDVILVRSTTSPDDVQGMLAARGIVTEIGGATSHAAVVSREIGRPAVVGCGAGVVDTLDGRLITVDGSEGEVREGILELTAWSEDDTPDLHQLAELARRTSPLRAHAAGDHPALEDTSPDGVRAALAAGYSDVISPIPLVTMLIALRLQSASGDTS
jgi:pyruvate,orthophosphate dikinase